MGMAKCIKCGKEAELCFRALKAETFHARDVSGDRRVQALGGFTELCVCSGCARAQLEYALRGVSLKPLLPYIAIFALGVLLTVVFWVSNGALRLMGIAAVVCGIAGGTSTALEAKNRRSEYQKLSAEQALSRAAWEAALSAAPKKDGDNDITYIPVTEETLQRKNGDLMILYDLLPDIAKQAWERLHGEG